MVCPCLAVTSHHKETKQRECWKLRDSRLNSRLDSRVHGQPFILSSKKTLVILFFNEIITNEISFTIISLSSSNKFFLESHSYSRRVQRIRSNLLSPFPSLIEWVCGGHYVYNPTLKRFFVFHFIFI